jgi:hypothetical protein
MISLERTLMKGHYFAEETLVALGRGGQPREVSLRGECSFKLKTTLTGSINHRLSWFSGPLRKNRILFLD